MKQRRVKQPCGLLLLNSNEPVLMKEANAEVSVIDMVRLPCRFLLWLIAWGKKGGRGR